jgi:hypothetical protein
MLIPFLRDITLWATFTFFWEALLKPLRTRRQVAHVLVMEAIQNYRIALTFHVHALIEGKLPAGFGLRTKGFQVCEGNIGALPTPLLTAVLRLYDNYDSIHRHRDYILTQWGKEIDEAAREFWSPSRDHTGVRLKRRPRREPGIDETSGATPSPDAPQKRLWEHIEELSQQLEFIQESTLEVAEQLHRVADPLWWPRSWFNADRRFRAQQLAEHRSAFEEKKAKQIAERRRREDEEFGAAVEGESQ